MRSSAQGSDDECSHIIIITSSLFSEAATSVGDQLSIQSLLLASDVKKLQVTTNLISRLSFIERLCAAAQNLSWLFEQILLAVT